MRKGARIYERPLELKTLKASIYGKGNQPTCASAQPEKLLDGIISKDDLRDVLATMGQLNVKNEELEAMVKEASGPINFTVFLTMFGEKLKGADPEDVIVSAFKVLDPEATGFIKKEFIEELLTTQCDRFTAEEMTNLWAAFPPDVAGNVDYKQICYVITHGEEKEDE
uniref:Myosin light chain, phosphorylatable, fast skeletal muscle b n=1 Tax=Hucho hucho TaxID=62062 RepID=A0A4W5M5F7_9TELE